jgi:hypothetical protein
MKFKQKFQQIISQLFGDKKAAKDLTAEEQDQVAAKYKEVFSSDMLEDFNKDKEAADKAAKYDAIVKEMATEDPEADPEEDPEEKPKDAVDVGKAIVDLKKENKELAEKAKKLEADVKKLGSALEPDEPKQMKVDMKVFQNQHSKTHLFGIENDFFSLEKRWNRLMIDPAMKDLAPSEDKKAFAAFQKEAEDFGAALAKRYQYLQSIGQLPKKGAAFTQTYTDLANAGLGDQFVVLRQDALIARIQELPNVFDIFPRRFGVQDRELMTNAFFGDFSQAWQTGAVYKGSMELQAEMGYVDDTMFKTLFASMKWLERQYVGYLNQEGSDPMKWSLIEWTLLQIATKLTMEQYERRILGVYAAPVAAEAGHYLHGSTGLVYSLMRYIHEMKLQVFTDAGLATYDNVSTNFVDAVIAFYDKLKESVSNFQENQYAMYLNANHKYWYRSQVRAKYGLQQDFSGPIDTVVPDTAMPIIWVPNMGSLKLIMVSKPGNFQCLENLPGEMLNVQFQPDMESYKAWSVWKEGFTASFVGKKFTTQALLLANAYALQEVFMNKPATDLADGATAAVGALNFWFKTIVNSAPTAFLGITGPKEGVAYVLECGGLANATTVAQAALFSTITAAYTPSALGDYLMFVWDATASKYFELERCVAGVRTINETKQPNIIGGR